MRALFLVLFVSTVCFFGFLQNLSAENECFKIVNKQNDKFIIKDNLRNAQLCTDSLLKMKNYNYLEAEFFYNLALNYFVLKKIDFLTFSLIRQRCLVHVNNNNKHVLLFKKLVLKYKKNIDYLFLDKQTQKNKINLSNKNEKFLKLLELSGLKSNNINNNLHFFLDYSENITDKKSLFWLAQRKLFHYCKILYLNKLKYIDFLLKTYNTTYNNLEDLFINILVFNKKELLESLKSFIFFK